MKISTTFSNNETQNLAKINAIGHPLFGMMAEKGSTMTKYSAPSSFTILPGLTDYLAIVYGGKVTSWLKQKAISYGNSNDRDQQQDKAYNSEGGFRLDIYFANYGI